MGYARLRENNGMGRVSAEKKLKKCLKKLDAAGEKLESTHKKLDQAKVNLVKVDHATEKKEKKNG